MDRGRVIAPGLALLAAVVAAVLLLGVIEEEIEREWRRWTR